MDWERAIDATLFPGCRLWETFRFRVLSHTRNLWCHFLHGLVSSFIVFTSIKPSIGFYRQDIHVITGPATAILSGKDKIINIECCTELTSTPPGISEPRTWDGHRTRFVLYPDCKHHRALF